MSEWPVPGVSLPVAELERRFHAFALDRLLGWSVVAASVAGTVLLTGHTAARTAAVAVAAAVLVALGHAVLLGVRGTSPGRAVVGVRVVDAESGAPIGVGRGLLRILVLEVATLPCLGLGAAMLAWSAAADPAGRRRGWHDRCAGSVVVDGRPPPLAAPAEEPAAGAVVNLTALRLVPAPAEPAPLPARAAPSRAPAAEPRWRVAFDTGESFRVAGLTLVGRLPEGRPGEPVRRLVALRSEDRSLSKTHAQFEVVPDGTLVVRDRGSTNGSVLVRGGVPRQLSGHQPATLLHDDRVRFGDRTMSVVRES